MNTSTQLSPSEVAIIRENRKTPCVGSCNTFYAEVCHACGRTIEEKARWPGLSEAEKDAIWQRLIQQGWKPRLGLPESARL